MKSLMETALAELKEENFRAAVAAEKIRLRQRRTFRWQWSRNLASPCGQPSVGFGVRVGYWPCLSAPYVQIAFLFWRLDLWHGRPSYRTTQP